MLSNLIFLSQRDGFSLTEISFKMDSNDVKNEILNIFCVRQTHKITLKCHKKSSLEFIICKQILTEMENLQFSTRKLCGIKFKFIFEIFIFC